MKYQIIIEDAAENCDEVLLSEDFNNAVEAQKRFDQLKAELADSASGWGNNLNLWLFEDGESVDGESC